MRFLLLPLQGRSGPCTHQKGASARRGREWIWMMALGVLALPGCNNNEVAGPEVQPGPVDEPSQRIGSLVLRAEADTVWLDGTTQLHATVLNVDGGTLADETVSYTSSNERILTVSSTGLATAVGPGRAAVTARAGESSATVVLFAATAAMTHVSGDGQTGDIGRPLPESFVIRITDVRGEGVGGIRVVWSVVSGAGDFLAVDGTAEPIAFTSTDAEGFAQTSFDPLTVGRVTVLAAADVDGVMGSPVTFVVEGALYLSDLPPFSGSPLIYERVAPDSFGLLSSYFLYDEGTFELRYSNGFTIAGKYSIEDRVIAFDFDANGWSAKGSLRGDSLSVEYNLEAGLDDFEDGVYVRDRSQEKAEGV